MVLLAGGFWFSELEYCYNGILWAIVWDPNKVGRYRRWSICSFYQYQAIYGIVFAIIWGPNKVIYIREWSICGCGQLDRIYCTFKIVSVSSNRSIYGCGQLSELKYCYNGMVW